MGATNNIILLLIGIAAWKFFDLTKTPPMPVLEENPWWGPGKPGKDDQAIRPFKIDIPKEDIKDLKARLSLPLRLTPSLENSNFTYGFGSDVLKVVLQYWQTQYDWKKREARLNAFPQYKTQIEGLDIHFIHVKPKVDPKAGQVTVLPLLMIHGWPGSVIEFDEILPILTTPQEGSNIVFEVICPSIPGYGFSQAPSKQGVGTLETSQLFLKLMKRLGFNKFYTQGGDWGSLIVQNMATLYPENVIGMHSNMASVNTPSANFKYFLGSFLPSGFVMRKEDEAMLYPISSFFSYIMRESGYMHLQSTKPDTVGAALSNSPAGLAAYILEKFSSWTNKQNPFKPDGGLLSNDFPISLDRLLDNVSLYWFTQSITSSMRFYAESFVPLYYSKIQEITTGVPSAFSVFSQEIFSHPKNMMAYKFTNIVAYRKHEGGGHFAAMEKPETLAKDIFDFVDEIEKRNQKIQSGEI